MVCVDKTDLSDKVVLMTEKTTILPRNHPQKKQGNKQTNRPTKAEISFFKFYLLFYCQF